MKHAPLLSLALTLLSFYPVRAAPLNLHYVVTTPQGGVVQELTVNGKEAMFYTFGRSATTGLEGKFTLSNRQTADLTRLSAGLKAYICKSSTVTDSQAIEIAVQGMHLRCTEACMDENRAVNQLIQAVRRLIPSHLH